MPEAVTDIITPESARLRDAYFAGLIDGEGGIYVLRRSDSGRRPCIKVNMTCQETILAIQAHFGAGTVRPRKSLTKPQWVWRVSYSDALAVAKRILPFLITKRAQAEQLLEYEPKRRKKAV